MFDFLKKRLVICEVDGIRFYTYKAFTRYLEERQERIAKLESRTGKHCYSFDIPYYQKMDIGTAKVLLEKHGCFDYEIHQNGEVFEVKYWAEDCILQWKERK